MSQDVFFDDGKKTELPPSYLDQQQQQLQQPQQDISNPYAAVQQQYIDLNTESFQQQQQYSYQYYLQSQQQQQQQQQQFQSLPSYGYQRTPLPPAPQEIHPQPTQSSLHTQDTTTTTTTTSNNPKVGVYLQQNPLVKANRWVNAPSILWTLLDLLLLVALCIFIFVPQLDDFNEPETGQPRDRYVVMLIYAMISISPMFVFRFIRFIQYRVIYRSSRLKQSLPELWSARMHLSSDPYIEHHHIIKTDGTKPSSSSSSSPVDLYNSGHNVITVADVQSKVQALDRAIPRLYFAVNCFTTQDSCDDLVESTEKRSDYYLNAMTLRKSPLPPLTSTRCHLYPIGITSFENTSTQPHQLVHQLSQSSPPTTATTTTPQFNNGSTLQLHYTYSLSATDQEWLEQTKAQLIQQHTTIQFPVVKVDVLYLLQDQTPKIDDSSLKHLEFAVGNISNPITREYGDKHYDTVIVSSMPDLHDSYNRFNAIGCNNPRVISAIAEGRAALTDDDYELSVTCKQSVNQLPLATMNNANATQTTTLSYNNSNSSYYGGYSTYVDIEQNVNTNNNNNIDNLTLYQTSGYTGQSYLVTTTSSQSLPLHQSILFSTWFRILCLFVPYLHFIARFLYRCLWFQDSHFVFYQEKALTLSRFIKKRDQQEHAQAQQIY